MPNHVCTGTVKRWIVERGFGFVIPEGGGQDVWVHRSGLISVDDLSVGDKVRFTMKDAKGRNGGVATDVVVTEKGGSLFSEIEAASDDSVFPLGLDQFFEIASEAGASQESIQDFVLESSLRCPFIVVSEGQLVDTLRAPSAEEFDGLLRLVHAFILGCEARGVVMLADFEGELPGHGGELSTAQFQLTSTVDRETLLPHPVSTRRLFRSPGLLVNLREERSLALARHILESPRITKLLWGASGDLQSLLFQVEPLPLRVDPVAFVDVQKAFDPNHPLGMARMLEHVRSELLEGLPGKEQIDWDAFHSRNERALPIPLERSSAIYAVDDLHRIEAIIGSKRPPSGSHVEAREVTERMLLELRADPHGLKRLESLLGWLQRREGVVKTVKAVQIVRHVLTLRDAGLTTVERSLVSRAENPARAELKRAGVAIPTDLSFHVR